MDTQKLIVQIRKALEIEILCIYIYNVPELFVTRDPLLTKASPLCSPARACFVPLLYFCSPMLRS